MGRRFHSHYRRKKCYNRSEINCQLIALATADVKLLWQSRKGLIKFLDMRNDDVTFYLAKAENDEGEEIDEVYEEIGRAHV